MKRYCLFFLCITSCSWQINPTHRYKIVYGDGFDIATQQGITTAVQQATDNWTYATNSYITFTFDDTDHDDTITVYGQTSAQIGAANGGACGIDFSHSASSEIYIPYDYAEAVLLRVVEHEMGHALGLEHTGPGTLMYWNLNGAATKITCADVSQLCNVWNAGLADKDKSCDPTTMPACENANVVSPDGGVVLLCHVGGIYQSCDPSNPYSVQVGETADINPVLVSCDIDACEYGQTCFLDGQYGVCDAEPQ